MSDYFGELYLRFWKTKLDAVADKEVSDILGLYETYASRKPSLVFDLGAGWGRHMIAFYRRGIVPYGIERETVFVETYRKEAPEKIRDNLIHGDITTWDVPKNLKGKADLAISLFSSIGWSDDTKVFKVASEVLKSGGIFIVDTDNRDAYVFHTPSRTWQRVEGAFVLDRHKVKWTDSTLTTKREIHTETGEEFTLHRTMRLYSIHELIDMGKQAGLQFLGAFSNLHMGAWSVRAGRTVAIFQKEEA